MNTLKSSNQAKADLLDIWSYIAQDNEAAADSLIDTITAKYQTILENSGIGRKREELMAGLRSFPVGRYVIYYHPQEEGIEIFRVIHGARDIENLL